MKHAIAIKNWVVAWVESPWSAPTRWSWLTCDWLFISRTTRDATIMVSEAWIRTDVARQNNRILSMIVRTITLWFLSKTFCWERLKKWVTLRAIRSICEVQGRHPSSPSVFVFLLFPRHPRPHPSSISSCHIALLPSPPFYHPVPSCPFFPPLLCSLLASSRLPSPPLHKCDWSVSHPSRTNQCVSCWCWHI